MLSLLLLLSSYDINTSCHEIIKLIRLRFIIVEDGRLSMKIDNIIDSIIDNIIDNIINNIIIIIIVIMM